MKSLTAKKIPVLYYYSSTPPLKHNVIIIQEIQLKNLSFKLPVHLSYVFVDKKTPQYTFV